MAGTIKHDAASPGLVAGMWAATERHMLEPGQSVEQRTAGRSLFRAGALGMLALLDELSRLPADERAAAVVKLRAEVALIRVTDPHFSVPGQGKAAP